jgi:hypothetical protein
MSKAIDRLGRNVVVNGDSRRILRSDYGFRRLGEGKLDENWLRYK